MLKARYQHSNGSCPPTSGTSATSTRRCMRGRRSSNTAWSRRCAARATSSSSSAPSASSLINFTWWVNRKDRLGKSVFEGGFLGLDNIGVFDRSAELPTGGHLEQADGTAWMAMFCQNMLRSPSSSRPTTPATTTSRTSSPSTSLDRRRHEQGRATTACGTRRTVSTTTCCGCRTAAPRGSRSARSSACCRSARRPSSNRGSASACRGSPRALADALRAHSGAPCAVSTRPVQSTRMPTGRTIAAVVDPERLRRILARMLDEEEFLSPYGIRSLSRCHEQHPYVVQVGREGVPGRLRAGRVGQRDVRREFELARAGVVSDERPAHSRAAAVLRLLRRLVPGGMSRPARAR